MRVTIIYWILLALPLVAAINQTCSFIEPCPNHATCNPLNYYCVCSSGFIGNCDVPADPIGEFPQMVNLRPFVFQLFYMDPI